MNTTKILFLDIDGVVCTLKSHFAYGNNKCIKMWDPTCCEMIKRLCIANDYKIVCTSTWRFDPKIMSYFKKYDLFDLLHNDWRTGADRDTRGKEIEAWLKNNENTSEYIIIDDDSDMLPEQLDRLITTKFKDGFSADNFTKANELMGGNFMKKYLT